MLRFYIFKPEISFPTFETGLMWSPPNQKLLFDHDDTTCINIKKDFTAHGQHLSLVINWDPNQKNSPRDDVATYYCQPEFFVNITHGLDVGISVYRGNGKMSGMIDNITIEIKECPMIGKSMMQGLLRSKFKCQCTAECHIIIKVKVNTPVTENSDDRICTVRVYD